MIKIPFFANEILQKIHASGYEAYAVGGCIRDALRDIEPLDWDICTSAFPNQIIDIFRESNTVIPTGLQHGTVTIISHGNPVEVTTYRCDGNYNDSRHPDKVIFLSSIEGDLARRDFTMNSIAYNKENGILDLYGGISDIKNQIIRCVGDPNKRFSEDALRIMRALRFAAVCNFNIEFETEKAIFYNKKLLEKISAERVLAEFKKILLSDSPSSVIIKYKEIFDVRIPIAKQNENIAVTDRMPKDISLRMAAVLCELSSDYAQEILKKLKAENELIRNVCSILKNKNAPIPKTKSDVKHLLNKLGYKSANKLFVYWSAKGLDTKNIEKFLEEISLNNECYSMDTLELNGSDLINLGFKKGTKIGIVLRYILDKVIDEEIENKKPALIEAAISCGL